MVRTGKVVGADKGLLRVCFDRPEMCASCGKCAAHGDHQELVTVAGNAPVGAFVEVEMPDAQVVKVSLIAYAVPLGFMLAGLLIGQTVLGTDLWAGILGVLFLLAGWGTVRLLDRRLGRKPQWKPRLIRVTDSFCPSAGVQKET